MSELRRDPVSGEWIIISTKRGKRPHEFDEEKNKREPAPLDTCPFEDLIASGNPPIELFPQGSEADWEIAVIPNKYPILDYAEVCPVPLEKGPYSLMDGKGHHEIVITKDHVKNLPRLSAEDALKLFKVFQHRSKEISKDECVNYTSFFHAWGKDAGASIYHPHYQILALPIVPPDIKRSLEGSKAYFEKNNRCVHCDMIDFDLKDGSRVIFENDNSIAVAPFVSREPFEVRIFPKKHESHFADSSEEVVKDVIEAVKFALSKVETNLNDPDCNFYIHTPPYGKEDKYGDYHWHIEVLPKTTTWGGFEWSTGVTVNIVDPNETAEILRK